jgi:hypothetical protein
MEQLLEVLENLRHYSDFRTLVFNFPIYMTEKKTVTSFSKNYHVGTLMATFCPEWYQQL